jgi:hypothetical protein
VGIEAVCDDDDAADPARRTPGAREDAKVVNALEGLFIHGGIQPFNAVLVFSHTCNLQNDLAALVRSSM